MLFTLKSAILYSERKRKLKNKRAKPEPEGEDTKPDNPPDNQKAGDKRVSGRHPALMSQMTKPKRREMMGRSITPTYVVETKESRHYTTPMRWDCKRDGRPTDANLEAMIDGLEKSTLPGGVNEHLESMFVQSAEIIRQRTGETVAQYKAPMFKVI